MDYIPLNAIRAFEAAARHLSFSAAGEELHVTHPAISHQIRRLEEWLGMPLFHRDARKVRLTEAGVILQASATAALAELGASLPAYPSQGRGGDNCRSAAYRPSPAAGWSRACRTSPHVIPTSACGSLMPRPRRGSAMARTMC